MSQKIFNKFTNQYAKFTNQYALSKTLRFELKPVGKTLENMKRNLRYDENLQTFLADQEIEDAYQVLKPVFDKIHEEFITSSLENSKNKGLFDFSAYLKLKRELFAINKKNDEKDFNNKEKEFKTEEKKLREFFKQVWEKDGENFKNKVGNNEKGKPILKEKSYKVLTEAGILKYIKARIDEFAKMNLKTRKEILWKKTNKNCVEKEDLEKALISANLESPVSKDNKGVFEGFFTYLSGFNENRENYYSTDEKSTAVANRVVAENLPKFCDNLLEFEKRKDEILKADDFLKGKNIALTAKDQEGKEIELHKVPAEIFGIGYFVNCLSQKEIEKYNLEIGNANNLINRYNQQKASKAGFKKIPKFKILYKQIGCGEKKEFIATIKDENELKEILKKIATQGEKFFDVILKKKDLVNPESENGFVEKVVSLENYNGVYWSDKAINTISSKYFFNWESLKELLKKTKVFKKEKDEIKIPQTIELSKLFEVLDNETVEFKETFKDNNDKKQEIVRRSDFKNSQKLLRMIFADIEANKKLFENEKDNILQITDPKKDENTQQIKTWLDSLLFSNQILKYWKVRENKIKGNLLNSEISEPLNDILFKENPTENYDVVRNFLTKKSTAELNKLKLNFENSVLAGGWDVNKEPERRCILLKDKENRKYLAILTKKTNNFFKRNKVENAIYDADNSDWIKMDYKLLPGPNKMLPKVLLPKRNRKEFGATDEILQIYDEGGFKKNDIKFEKNEDREEKIKELKKSCFVNFKTNDKNEIKSAKYVNKEKLHRIIDFYKEGLKLYQDAGTGKSWQETFNFNFSSTDSFKSIDQFYNEVERQGYKLGWNEINKALLDEKVEQGEIYLFEIRNKDNNLRDGKEKLKDSQNLHTIYWNAVFGSFENKPKLNGEAEIFYRPIVKDLIKDKDKNGNIIGASKKRFEQEKFIFHCPITLNFCLKSSKMNDKINSAMIKNSDDVCFIGIDRGEKHLAYYSLINSKGEILEQGSLNEIGGQDYAKKLEEKAGNRDEARKSWKTIGTIKELKDGYISQVVRKIVDLAIYKDADKKELREAPAYIILENLNIGFKRGRQKIEKSVYQKLELALAKKLNFVVDKKAKDGEIMSVEKALQLTPSVQNFKDIGNQCGIMLYVRANYTSQTDPITGWRKTIYFNKTKNEDLKAEICEKFDEIGFDGKDYYFTYTTKYEKEKGKKKEGVVYEEGARWTMWSGKDGKSLDRFRGKKNTAGIWEIKKQAIGEILNKVFGEQKEAVKNLRDKITDKNVKDLKYALDLIQQIRNTGIEEKDNDFILSPARNKRGEHFDSRKSKNIPNGDANGAFNIARKGLMTFEKIKKDEKKDLNITDKEWDLFLTNKEN